MNLMILSLDESSPSFTDYLVAEWHERSGAISPDGRWVAYSSNESGTWEVYARRLRDSGGQVQVSSGGGMHPRWAPDGTAIYYTAPPGTAIWYHPSILRSEIVSGENLQAGTPEVVFQGYSLAAISAYGGANFDIHPDGTRFLMVQPMDEIRVERSGTYLVTGWFEELHRRARQ